MTSVNRNVAFNYGGQLYSTLIGIVVLPLFLAHVGAEAYGLIGFYTLVQAWMSLVDLGMTPTIGREVARLKTQPSEASRLVTIVNSLEVVFVIVAGGVAFSMVVGREWLSAHWLTVEKLDMTTVETAVAIIGVTVAVRWASSLNRSGVNAFEHQVWLNIFEVVINTLRFPVALLLVIWLDGNVLAYFYFQLAVVGIEFVILRRKLRSLLSNVQARRFSWPELKRIAPFAISIGYTTAIWVLLTQLDKLVLSKTLTLSEYGYFTLVATVSSGVMMLSGPVSKAILPRMTALLAEGKKDEMIQLYRKSTRLIVILVMPIAITIACMPYSVLFVWTGNEEAARWGEQILPLFILGSATLAIVAFQYHLQYVYGNLKYHVRYNTFSVLANVPLIIYFAIEFGPIGIAWLWFGSRLLSLLVWVPFIHNRFAPGLHKTWFLNDVLIPLILVIGIVLIGVMVSNDLEKMSRFLQFSTLAIISASANLLAAAWVFRSVFGRLRFG
jgi:O-antigen/teichoic acid export membrane protein|tara:strand:- start:6463 stop:7953 length:1491 start_codon:yes stop_codon:yes gene_type:complete